MRFNGPLELGFLQLTDLVVAHIGLRIAQEGPCYRKGVVEPGADR